MKYQTASLLLAGLAAAAPVAQTQAAPPSNDAARAGGILSGLADGMKGASFPGAESVGSILGGLGGGLSKAPPTRRGAVDVDALIEDVQKRQNQNAHPPPTPADMERASSILSGLANGMKGASFPGSKDVSSILSGVGTGLNSGAKVPTKRQNRHERPERPERTPPTAADMERASSILKGVSNGLKGTFPGSTGVSSLLSGLSGGIHEGAKNPPPASNPTTATPANVAAPVMIKEKRQTGALPPPGTPEARKSASEILNGLAKGFGGSSIPTGKGVAGILGAVGGGLEAGAALPPAPGAARGRVPQ